MKWRYIYIPFVVIMMISNFSCKGSYQKLLKSSDYDLKFTKAKQYYNKGDYIKAIPLFEELIGVLKGTKDVEDLYYFYPYCYYGQGNYEFSAYYFKNFIEFYPRSSRAEDARFMIAYCYYKMSPMATLDQDNSYKTIEALQFFADTYPKSEKVAECNALIDELRSKLEVKAYKGAKLYYDMKDYRAAATSFNNLLIDFPETERQEEVQFLILQSYYFFAEKSIETKQEERYEKAVDAYLSFINKYPESNNIREAENIYQDINEKLDKLKTIN